MASLRAVVFLTLNACSIALISASRLLSAQTAVPLQFSGNRYTVMLKASDEGRADIADDSEVVRMVDSAGKHFVCELPGSANMQSRFSATVHPESAADSESSFSSPLSDPLLPTSPETAIHSPIKGDWTTLAATAHSILQPMHSICTRKRIEWWTYEVCHGDELRQFHAQDAHKLDSSQSWSLGRLHPDSVSSGTLDLVNTQEADGNQDIGTMRLVYSFWDGKHCSEIGTPRSGNVSYGCGKAPSGMPAAIKDVDECVK